MRVSIHDTLFPRDILVIDVDAREFINGCISADDETGEYTCYASMQSGQFTVPSDEIDQLITKKGNIRIVKTDNIKHLFKN